jgi:hypothetical protein
MSDIATTRPSDSVGTSDGGGLAKYSVAIQRGPGLAPLATPPHQRLVSLIDEKMP